LAVRVRVRVSWGSRAKTVVALVNSGAESEEPVIVLRPEDAEELGLPLKDFDIVEVELASGRTHGLISKGNALSSTPAYLVVDEGLTEPLITDATIDELGIVVASFKRGLWRHVNDPPNIVRQSAHR